MIASMGYPSQTHTVITEDCYILEMHRIPHGKSMSEATKPPVLLVHIYWAPFHPGKGERGARGGLLDSCQ